MLKNHIVFWKRQITRAFELFEKYIYIVKLQLHHIQTNYFKIIINYTLFFKLMQIFMHETRQVLH